MTQKNLEEAFAGESQAHMKYLAFADKARKQGHPNIARLFEATAFAERVHATNHLNVLSGIGDTPANLSAAIEGETFEFEEMYAAYVEIARLQGEKAAERTTNYALEAEKTHAVLYADAKAHASAGNDAPIADVYVCDMCGYTVTGEAPDVCPVCKVKKEHFRKF